MVKSYFVKEKKQTECVPGSERYVKAKNETIGNTGITVEQIRNALRAKKP